MATHSDTFIRVRLHFDYPPPALVGCRMCWLLVDLNTCRVVADLESIIREKFDFSRRSILNLFVEDYYLPHTESIYVLRDNDSVRVKVEYLVNGDSSYLEKASENSRKRQRPSEENEPEENGVSAKWKKKRKKKGSEESLEGDAKQATDDEKNKKSREKRTVKKKKKKAEKKSPAVTPKPAASTKNTPFREEQPVKSNKKSVVAQKVSSSDSSSSSSEDEEAPKKPAAQKPAPKTPSSTPASAKAHPKPTHAKLHPPSSSSSETSSDEATTLKPQPKRKPTASTTPKRRTNDESRPQPTPPAPQSTNCAQKKATSGAQPPNDQLVKPCTSSSEEEIELVIRRPAHQPGFGVGGQSPWRGRGRGGGRRGGPAGRGKGDGRGDIRGQNGSIEVGHNGNKEPSYQTDSLTNSSVVIQNVAESSPQQDYSSMPLLAAPPKAGQRIAFKLLELTENYTPEVSEYKEGKIVSFDHTTKQIELELQNSSKAQVEPGKFDLVYQNPDGSERVEYAVSRDSRVIERWDSLLEPRLMI